MGTQKGAQTPEKLTVVTEGDHVAVPHGVVAAVRQRPLPPGGRLLPGDLPRADADDAAHQPTLGLLLAHFVFLRQRVDELVDGLALVQEERVRGAARQLLDLILRVELQQLLGNQGVHVLRLVLPVLQLHGLVQGRVAGLGGAAQRAPLSGRPAFCLQVLPGALDFDPADADVPQPVGCVLLSGVSRARSSEACLLRLARRTLAWRQARRKEAIAADVIEAAGEHAAHEGPAAPPGGAGAAGVWRGGWAGAGNEGTRLRVLRLSFGGR